MRDKLSAHLSPSDDDSFFKEDVESVQEMKQFNFNFADNNIQFEDMKSYDDINQNQL